MDADITREFDRFDKRLMAVEDVPMRLAAMEVEFRGIVDDLRDHRQDAEEARRECREGIEELRRLIAQRAIDREKERKEASQERKQDRRFLVTTMLSTAAIVVVAVGIIVSAL